MIRFDNKVFRSKMKYLTWNDFIGKYPDNPQDAFEALCRLLFRTKYGIGDSLPYFYNNAGDETIPITVGKDVIGFQCKFFSGETIDDQQAGQIKHSIKKAHEHYPNQNRIIVYTNLVFGNPPAGSKMTVRQKDVEDTAKANALTIEWMFGDNILDLVSKTTLAYSLFFETGSNLNHLPASVERMNELNFGNISSTIKYQGNDIEIDRTKEVSDLKEYIQQGKNILVFGESGSGKSAIVKRLWMESAMEKSQVFYFTRGAQYDTKSINDLFLMDEAYTYAGFRDLYEGFSKKILVIDSAERLTEIGNLTVLQLVLEGLNEKGWQFVFTCKSNAYDALRFLLRDIGVNADDLKVDSLQEQTLRELATQHRITLPQSEKMIRQIQIPFYLARYCELSDIDVATPEAFREAVWQQKVRGTTRGGSQYKREECLLKIVLEQQAKNAFFVSPANLDHDAAYSLIQEDVLIEQSHRGYAVKHDLYVDWVLEYIVEKECNTEEDCVQMLQSAPKSITYLNAFGRWLQGIIDNGDRRVEAMMDAFINKNTHRGWEHCLLSTTGGSKTYATIFFARYEVQLKANDYELFDRFVDVLDVSCKGVSQYLEYKGERIPIYSPIGRGWEDAVLFVYANKDDYYMNHLGTVQKLLNGYSRMGSKAVAMTQASQLSLIIFDVIAEKRKQGEWFIFGKEKPWCELVCTYAFGIRNELKERFEQVITNRWVGHTDPYAELIDYILKDSNNITKSMLYLSCLESVIALMQLFWREQPKDPRDRRWRHHDSFEREDVFGLNEDFGMAMAYFPSSPFQTPTSVMLESEHLIDPKGTKVLDFIIDFVNDCVQYYDKRDQHDSREHISVQLPDGTSHDVICSQTLWNLYRGTASYTIPHLLESIHMALEVWLLKLTDEKQKPDWDFIKQLLWRMLIKSHSASLYAIAASVVLAHPDELFDFLMFLCQDIRFLAFDLHRCSAEISVHTHSIAFSHHQAWWEERERSNNLPHRQQHLETMLLNCQYAYDNTKDEDLSKRLDVAYQLVDKLKEQVAQIGQENSIYQFILARADYRSYKKEDVTLSNGIEAVQLMPTFSPELEEERRQTAEFANRLGAVSLRVWADKRFKGEEKDLKGNLYLNNPKAVLEAIRKIEKQLTEHVGDQLLMPGDSYIPYMASAVLLMFEKEHLDEAEKKECWERVMLALNSLGAMASNTLSELNICIAAIPALIELQPERYKDFIPIIAAYVKTPHVFINERVCDMMSDTIYRGQLWTRYPELMNSVLTHIQSELSHGEWETMNADAADAVLCLLTYNPDEDKRQLGRICVEKLSMKWQVSSRDLSYMDKSHISENVAKYVLYAPKEEVSALIRPYVSLIDLDSRYEPLITQFLIGVSQYSKYENFWLVWGMLYKAVMEGAGRYYHNSALNEYLLNPLFMSQDLDEWFILEEKDLPFFVSVANDIGGHPAVMYAFTRVFATIGKRYSKQAIALMSDIINKHHPKLDETKTHVVYYLEKIVKKVIVENDQDIRSDLQFKNHLITVLEFLRSNGSSLSDGMIKNL